jgi:hypothetical protein
MKPCRGRQPILSSPQGLGPGLAQRAGRRGPEDLLAFAVGVELEVFHTLLADDVTSIVGLKGRHRP